jgi:IS4 transposase
VDLELVMLKQREIESECRFTSHRKADFRRGKRLGKDDHIVTWFKPTKPRSIDRQTYNTLPDSLTIRECRVQIVQPGFRVKVVVIATTLLDHVAYPPSELAELYRARWNAELDLKSLNQTLQQSSRSQ